MSMKQCVLGQTPPTMLSSLVQHRLALPVIVTGCSRIPSIHRLTGIASRVPCLEGISGCSPHVET
ncbi:hypothetical protein M3J09_002573 [Ascochyta lentis]